MSLLQSSKIFLKRNASTILTCIGSAGVIATSVMAVKETPKALVLLENAKEEKGEELTKLEAVKIAGPVYIPSIIVGMSTIACIFGANILNKRQQAALISAYTLLDNSYKEYRNKVVELYGEDADEHVRKEIAKDKYEESDIETEDNKLLFYDEYSMKYFNSTMEDVIKAEYEINRILAERNGAFLNEFYDLLKLPQTNCGDVLGWSTYELMESTLKPWIDFNHRKVELEDGMECYILEIVTDPIPNIVFA